MAPKNMFWLALAAWAIYAFGPKCWHDVRRYRCEESLEPAMRKLSVDADLTVGGCEFGAYPGTPLPDVCFVSGIMKGDKKTFPVRVACPWVARDLSETEQIGLLPFASTDDDGWVALVKSLLPH